MCDQNVTPVDAGRVKNEPGRIERTVIQELDKDEILWKRFCSKNRPCFGPDQVRYMHQLKKGQNYYRVHLREDRTEAFREAFRVTREPYQKKEGGYWWIDVEYSNEKSLKDQIALVDRSIHAYLNGLWNKRNYMTFSDDSRHLAGCQSCCCCHCHHGCLDYHCS